MVREIIYRGRIPFTTIWVTGSIAINTNGSHCLYYIGGKSKALNDRVLGKTVGQLTGLQDRNGIEICHGDIVKSIYANDCIGVIKFGTFIEQDYDEGVVTTDIEAYGFYNESISNGCKWTASLLTDGEPWFEVIGNIHDNPELLEASNE